MKTNLKYLPVIIVVCLLSYQVGRYKAAFHQPYIVQMENITQASLDLCQVDGDCMDIQEVEDDNEENGVMGETEFSQGQDEAGALQLLEETAKR